ncbi:YciI family protein [Sandaracinus amylolyticus]|uniref:YCII-related domain-containing protein n=1 Tax=Sandaracinus amylolyticus TaxID=927083 RepID=A0A0F6YGM7_9BACT|nr:YciI family protein [Sandaracinus amylolyticus]AKF04122.1 Hypothetical protein DB32_001271 [Sandaracinus amylolyticus]
MTYLLLIYEVETDWQSKSEAQRNADLGEYMAVSKLPQAKGGNALQPVATAKTVRVRDGKMLTTDGPFAETREQLGGYYVVEAKDFEEACAIAAKIPAARNGSIEVRPVMKYS